MTKTAQSNPVWRRKAVTLLAVAGFAAVSIMVMSPSASAADPTATMFSSVVVSGVTPPAGASGSPSAVVVQNTGFSITVSFSDDAGNPLPPSWNKDSTVTFTVEPSADDPGGKRVAKFQGTNTVVIPNGATTATATGLKLAPADNRIRIGAKITAGSNDAKAIPKAFSAEFDVLFTAFSSSTNNQQFINTAGTFTPCDPTPSAPYCADLFLPFGSQTGTLLTVGKCDAFLGCNTAAQLVVQVLANLGPSYSNTTPATLVYRCDKSACPGKGVNSYHVSFSSAPNGPLAVAAGCDAKGVVDPGLDKCVDYVQSNRSNAGDLNLNLLIARDARMSCC